MKQRFLRRGMLLLSILCLLLTACGKEQPMETTTGSADTGTDPQVQATTQVMGPGGTVTTAPAATDATEPEGLMPWEADGAKQPEAYTLEEYEEMSAELKKAFREHLGDAGYAAWLERAEAEAEPVDIPWEKPGAKQPKDYTWAEYQALTEGQKKAFMEHLGPYGLEAWLKKVQGNQGQTNQGQTNQGQNNQSQVNLVKNPWDLPGAKKPQDYTMKDYEALTANQKKAFQNYLGKDGFAAWQESVQKKENPWEEDGAKQPENYTWEEYQTLTEAQKTAFQEKLGADGFASWLEKVHEKKNPWEESGAREPKDYTWEEYEALTAEQQADFQNYLGRDGMKTWLKKITDIPWEKPKSKQPEDYTLKEYEDLEDPQQLAFRVWLGEEEFEVWLQEAENPPAPNPWDTPGAKQPADYTLAEFEALTAGQQMAFQNYLGAEGFEAWLNRVQQQPAENPWDAPGAKQPADYTLADFEALTAEQQMAFQSHLGEDGFQTWLNKVQQETDKNPWELPGAKQPQDYTWKEYQALTAAQQMAFQSHLGAESFEAWLNKVQGDQNQGDQVKHPWDEPGAKKPEDYTMAEFEALTAAQQMAFQNYLGEEGFEAWLNRVQNQTAANPWEVPGAKQPEDYTWEEFEALTAAQQMAFQNCLGAEGFEAWLNKVQNQTEKNPWEQPGAKQPEDYTYEEFEALTAAQQMAFQNYLGEEGFEAWLNRVLG